MRDICLISRDAGHLMKMRDCPSECGTVDTYVFFILWVSAASLFLCCSSFCQSFIFHSNHCVHSVTVQPVSYMALSSSILLLTIVSTVQPVSYMALYYFANQASLTHFQFPPLNLSLFSPMYLYHLFT